MLTTKLRWIPTPALIGYKVPSDNDYFSVPYFDKTKVWLCQTAEFHQQMAISMDFSRVFEIRTLFRAEDQVSKRRLTEASHLPGTDWHSRGELWVMIPY